MTNSVAAAASALAIASAAPAAERRDVLATVDGARAGLVGFGMTGTTLPSDRGDDARSDPEEAVIP